MSQREFIRPTRRAGRMTRTEVAIFLSALAVLLGLIYFMR